ncbi:NmrA family NAD(P)-binding protein [Streptomyces parvulus]|uniref:NmrA family NAD(P)-binding protein n=1 Tax=Streptomyces parvulus TaxID=146923 RepID=UPI00371BEF5D
MGKPTEGNHADDAGPILVTGATGRHGGTGGHVVNDLLARGLGIRALVRTRDERDERLASLGAHVVVGDFADHDSLLGALDGVTGHRVTHQEITADQWRDEVIAEAQGRANPRGAAHLAAQAASLCAKPQAAVRDDVTRLTARPRRLSPTSSRAAAGS